MKEATYFPDTKKTILLAALFLVLAATAWTQERSAADDFRIPEFRLKKVERMVDVNGRKIHAIAYGKGKPAIVLLSGLNAPPDFWNALIRPVAEKTTVVTYDRPGSGASQIGSLPVHGQQAASDLKELLARLELPPPYILIGHSYGANVARLFAAAAPGAVCGMIFLDGQHPGILDEQLQALEGEDRDRLQKMIAALRAKPNPKSEGDFLLVTLEQGRQAAPMPPVPYAVVSSGANRLAGIPAIFSEAGRQKLAQLAMELQQRLAAEIPGGEHVLLPGIGPALHNEDPKPIVKIVKSMLSRVRKAERP